MRQSLRIVALLLVAGLVLLAAGCGDSKKTATPTANGATDATGSTGSTGTTGSNGSFASSENCLAFASLAGQIASAMAPTSGDESGVGDAGRYLQAIADAAPDDIKGDLQEISTALSGYLETLRSSGYDATSGTPPTAAQMAAIVDAAKVFNTPKLKQAEQHLSAWEKHNCK